MGIEFLHRLAVLGNSNGRYLGIVIKGPRSQLQSLLASLNHLYPALKWRAGERPGEFLVNGDSMILELTLNGALSDGVRIGCGYDRIHVLDNTPQTGVITLERFMELMGEWRYNDE